MFTSNYIILGEEPLEPVDKPLNLTEYYNQLQRDAMWSDPSSSSEGVTSNSRGLGIAFGHDITRKY